MAANVPYSDRKEGVRAELVRCAMKGRTIYYSALGELVDIPARGPWKPLLDEIGREELARGKPDVTVLVIAKQTGFPGQIGFKPAKPPTAEQKEIAERLTQRVFAYYGQPASG